MQKQLSPNNSSEKYSITSRSGRKLYHRINENNIRVINKSKISSRSNKSIGSIALRRTQLSNDKIYSREEENLQLNSLEIGEGYNSGFQLPFDKKSGNMVTQMSNYNSRPRGPGSPSQRSLRSDSQKSSKYRPNPRKYNKYEIQKLFMLEANQPISNGPQNKRHLNKLNQRSNSKRQKQHVPSSKIMGEKQFYIQSQNNSKLKSLRSIKSSNQLNTNINSLRSSKDQEKYVLSRQESSEITKLARKYKKIVNEQTSRDKNKREAHNDWQEDEKKQKSRNLQKYRSQKYLPSNQTEVQSIKSKQKLTNVEKKANCRQYEQNLNKYYYEDNRSKKDKAYQNQLQKYQKETWTRTINRKNQPDERNHMNEKFYNSDQAIKSIKDRQHVEYNQSGFKKDRSPRQYYKQQSKSKHQISKLHHKNIKIKEEQYSNFYENFGDEYNNSERKDTRNRNHHKSPSYKSPYYRQQQQDHEYYHYITSPNKKSSPHYQTPKTEISSTFDSLILSINSHMTSGITGESSSIKLIIDKINLHLNTLEMIADYAQEFKKMYQQIDQWEELIFLAYKKYWVERVKVIEYLKRFRRSKKHESERIAQKNGSNKIKNSDKIMNIKNICSDMPRNIDDPFADQNLITNPFIIPFCKVTQEQVKRVVRSEEGGIMLQKIESQTSKVYQNLQEMYNLAISKSGDRINMLYCDNFSDDIFIMMLDEIEQLIPNLEEFKIFEATKIRLGKVVKSGILILYLNGKVIRNIAQILTFDDCEKIGKKKKIKTFTTYDLYYEVFEKMVAE